MQFEIYQWLVPLLCLLFLGRIIRQYLNGRRSLRSSIFWFTLAIGVSILALLPDQVSFPVAQRLGFKSNINAVIFVALGVLFVINYSLSQKVIRLERKLEQMTRNIAKSYPQIPEKE